MRLPQPLLQSRYFIFETHSDLIAALIPEITGDEGKEIDRLASLSLPPITSREALATMLGVSPGLVWSLQNRPLRHYRVFEITTGKKVRTIQAPRIALKVIQKWLSVQLNPHYIPPNHVFGFVPGRSHIDAAAMHCGATWVYSVDIKDFFPTTPASLVVASLAKIGYNVISARLIAELCCYNGFLPQGAPTSPLLSNLAFAQVDESLSMLAKKYSLTLTRYADDVVFSGQELLPEGLSDEIQKIFASLPWSLAEHKTEFSQSPNRLKVHGLLVHGNNPRLTKGYRNKIRAYSHLLKNDKVMQKDIHKIRGHLNYLKQVVDRQSDKKIFPADPF